MKLVETVEVDAPLAVAWQVIVDLDRYGEWNPFVVAAASTLDVGDPIEMSVKLLGFVQPQRETITEHVPGSRLCYGVAPRALGALRSRRCHEVEAISETRCRYTSRFELSGWLEPLVRGLLGRRLARGFAANTQALEMRAESLART